MKYFLSVTIALVSLFSASTLSAQSPRLKSPLTTSDLGLNLRVCYDISGLGSVDKIVATCTYTATVNSDCFNPGESTGPVPGQRQVFSGVQEEIVIPVHNGRATGCFNTARSFPAGGCPNSKWTGTVSNVTFSSITLTVDGRTFSAPNPQ